MVSLGDSDLGWFPNLYSERQPILVINRIHEICELVAFAFYRSAEVCFFLTKQTHQVNLEQSLGKRRKMMDKNK